MAISPKELNAASSSSVTPIDGLPNIAEVNAKPKWQPIDIAAKRRQQRFRLMATSLVVVGLLVVMGLGAWQIKFVREFFGQAAGEEANLVIDTRAILGPLPRPWRNLAQGGEDHDWRMGSLVSSVKAIKPRYIRIDHIYDFYDIVKGSPGNLSFDFSKFDGVIDDILATGAKPYVALSYMPPAITGGDILSVPNNWGDWQLTVQKTIEHLSGTRKISDVYYEVWNEPDLFGKWHYSGAKNYLTLYTYAARGAQAARVSQPFKIGGPAITALYKNWFDALAKHVLANNLRLDFFSWHRYTTDIDQYKKDMTNAKEWLANYPQLEPTLQLHITEWGPDSEVNPVYDGANSAAHTVAGSIEMINIVENAFSFEIQDGKDPAGKEYWGRWGLFTHNDFGAKPKPRYRALRLLDRIGTERLQIMGKGSWVKAVAAKNDKDQTEVVIANYDARGGHSENVPVTFQNVNPGEFTVTKEYLSGNKQTEKIATTAAVVQTHVAMPANSVVFLTLQGPPDTSPAAPILPVDTTSIPGQPAPIASPESTLPAGVNPPASPASGEPISPTLPTGPTMPESTPTLPAASPIIAPPGMF